MLADVDKIITDLFHTMYYSSRHTWNYGQTTWMGVPVFQNPLDMWIIQEIIHDTRPDIIIETGSALGGSALFYISCSPYIRVISIDVQKEMVPVIQDERITFIRGMSTNPEIISRILDMVGDKRVMVLLDSDHSAENVLNEMLTYGPMVGPGCYMIVCDTNLGGNPIYNTAVPGRGPRDAVERFLSLNKMFEVDYTKHKFYMTFFPGGWLRKKGESPS